MVCSTPGFPVHYQLPEPTQIHVHWVCDAIQPSHPLLSPSPPAFSLSQRRVFSYELVLWMRWPEYWSFSFSISPSSEYSGLIFFRMDWLDLLAVLGTLKSLLQHQYVWNLKGPKKEKTQAIKAKIDSWNYMKLVSAQHGNNKESEKAANRIWEYICKLYIW